MNFYETGDLEQVLKQQRSKETPLPEPIVKRWFGQMVEALQFVHAQRVIHRDLKPTNIFMTKDLDISIGDFGVATVMNDARTRTRTTVGTMTWMAPEVLERPYDERSDVWSLGCIILDTASCGFSDTKQSQQAMFEIKQNPAKLNDVLKGVELSYSKELSGVISQMLRRDFQSRPTINDLIAVPYVRSCLALSKSDLVSGDTSRAYTAASVKPKTTKRIPAAVPEIVGFLKEHLSRVACMVAGLEEMTKQITQNGAGVPDEDGKKQIIVTMAEHPTNVWVQMAAVEVLHAIAEKVPEADLLYTEPFVRYVRTTLSPPFIPPPPSPIHFGFFWFNPKTLMRMVLRRPPIREGLEASNPCPLSLSTRGHARHFIQFVADSCGSCVDNVAPHHIAHHITSHSTSITFYIHHIIIPCRYTVEAMRKHQGSVDMQKHAIKLISVMAENDTCGPIVGALGGVQDVIGALRLNAQDVDIVTLACEALYNLALHGSNAAVLKDEGGVLEVANALSAFSESPRIAAAACGLFWSQSADGEDGDDDDAMDQLVDSGCIGTTNPPLSHRLFPTREREDPDGVHRGPSRNGGVRGTLHQCPL